MVFISGLDWSGDFGYPGKKPDSGFVVAICSASRGDLEEVHLGLERVRRALGFDQGHVFHHKNTQPKHRDMFFESIQQLQVMVTCGYVDLKTRLPIAVRCKTGGEEIRRAIVATAMQLPPEFVANGTLIVDMNRGEKGFIRSLKHDLRTAGNRESRKGFSRVNARPDHRDDSGLIQVADMFAGRLNKTQGKFDWNGNTRLQVWRLNEI